MFAEHREGRRRFHSEDSLLATQKSGLFKMIENNYKFISVVKGKEGNRNRLDENVFNIVWKPTNQMDTHPSQSAPEEKPTNQMDTHPSQSAPEITRQQRTHTFAQPPS